MYDAFFDDVKLLKKENFCEISYDELVAEPVATLERIYAELGIDGFADRRQAFEEFASTQKKYQKNKFELAPEIKETISRRWKAYFDRYYPAK